ncbi:MAG: OmpH family outer membrane protein [Desulfatibacillaceae bacterium]
MQKAVFAALIVAVLAFGLAPGVAAQASRVGVVDMQKVLDNSVAGKEATARLKARGEEMESRLTTQEQEIREMRNNLEQGLAVMNRDTREQRERELRIAINDIKLAQKRYLEEFREMEARLTNRIRDESFAILEEMGREGDYDLIMEKREGGILFFQNAFDLTDALINEYNERYSKQKN